MIQVLQVSSLVRALEVACLQATADSSNRATSATLFFMMENGISYAVTETEKCAQQTTFFESMHKQPFPAGGGRISTWRFINLVHAAPPSWYGSNLSTLTGRRAKLLCW